MTIPVSREVLNDIIEALTQAAEYFEPRMDADGDSEGYYPNEEMQLYTLCGAALEALPWLAPMPASKPKPSPLASSPYPDGINEVLALKR